MAATRRSFFGFVFGAAAAVPALPKIVEAMGGAPGGVREIYRGVTTVRTCLPSVSWRIFNQGASYDEIAELLSQSNEILDDMIGLDDDDQD